jgi:hypothetical protein
MQDFRVSATLNQAYEVKSMSNYHEVEVELVVDDTHIETGDVFEPMKWGIDIYEGPAVYTQSQQRFSEPQRQLFAMIWYIEEVNNGGHKQFYSNSTGIVWQDACNGFAAMGLKEVASIILDSAKLLGGSPSLDRASRQSQLEEFKPDFRGVDKRFYDLESSVDLSAAMLAYVRANPTAFYFSGKVTRLERIP